MLLVYGCGNSLKALPDTLPELLCHRANLLPLIVQILQLLKGINHIRLLLQRLRALADSGLGLHILLEVQIPELVVYLNIIVELLHKVLIGIPYLLYIGLRNLSYLLPSGLKVTECREGLVHILRLLQQSLKLLNYSHLLGKILVLLPLHILYIKRTLTPVLCKELLKSLLYLQERILFLLPLCCCGAILEGTGCNLLSLEHFVKRGLYDIRIFVQFLLVSAGQHLFKCLNNLFQSHRGVVGSSNIALLYLYHFIYTLNFRSTHLLI